MQLLVPKTRTTDTVVPTASWSTTILPMTKSCSDETAALRGGFNRSPHEPIWQLSAYCVCGEKQGLREAAIHFGYNISPLARLSSKRPALQLCRFLFGQKFLAFFEFF